LRAFVCALLAGAETADDLARQGREFKAKGDAASALRAFERAASLDPSSAGIEDEIGFLLAALNRRSEAIPHLKRLSRSMRSLRPPITIWVSLTGSKGIPTEASRSSSQPLA